jgi:hypothetical protein
MRIVAVNETWARLVHLMRLGRVAASHDPVPRYRVMDRLTPRFARQGADCDSSGRDQRVDA